VILPVLPSASELRPWLAKLETHEGSIVIICLESFQTRTDCRVSIGWFDAEEKVVMRNALLRCKRKRKAKQDATKANAPL